MPIPIAIAFGANTGDRQDQIQRAVDLLAKHVQVVQVSPLYETAPMYVEDQPPFVNGALSAKTELGPLALLRLLKQIEGEVGRAPTERYGPREIDLDLVLYGALSIASDPSPQPSPLRADRPPGGAGLYVPHPRLPERRFVLQPLYDLDPSMQIPGMGSIQSLLDATESQAATVRKMNDAVVSISIHRR